MANPPLYAPARIVTDPRECDFYHTMELPGHGQLPGDWDLRPGLGAYLGNVAFAGKRVLDVGTANGCLTFFMENQGAEVVSYDLSPGHPWDVVPFAGQRFDDYLKHRREHLCRINNGYWLCHRALQSRARMVYGTVYAIPEAIGPVDIATFGSILLHLRDPFLALQNVLQMTRETVIIADVVPRRSALAWFLGKMFRPRMTFLPRSEFGGPIDTWWNLSPTVIRRFIGVLGFDQTRITYHRQWFKGSRRLLYTIVGHRTRPAPTLRHDWQAASVAPAA